MLVSTEERNRILRMVEGGQLSADEAAQLLDALVVPPPLAHDPTRTIRVWMSNMTMRRQEIKMTATLPLSLVENSLRLLSRVIPQLNDYAMQSALRSIERGATGRILDVQDLEEGKRLEIFIEP